VIEVVVPPEADPDVAERLARVTENHPGPYDLLLIVGERRLTIGTKISDSPACLDEIANVIHTTGAGEPPTTGGQHG
jgi:hypothetical protein